LKFTQQLEKFQKSKLFILKSPTTFLSVTFQNSKEIFKYKFEIKGGQFMEICIFKITLDFALEL